MEKSGAQIYMEMEERCLESFCRNSKEEYYKETIIPYRKSQKIIDLHTHTKYSDGELSVEDLVRLAIKSRISVLSITDHDTLEAYKKLEKNEYLSKLVLDSGIKIIPGIELTAKVPKGRMHILGYDIDIYDKELNKKIIELKDNSINSVLSIIEQIKRDYGIIFSYEDIKNLVNSNHNLGRPDVAKLCIKYGYAKTVQEAFDKYLIEAYNKTNKTRKGINYQECLELIIKSGGIPVLAHPKSLELSEKDFLILLKEMISSGLKGIEVYHSSHTPEEMEYYENIANEYNLLISGGSDFHGPLIKPNIKLGTGNNNLNIKKLSLLGHVKY